MPYYALYSNWQEELAGDYAIYLTPDTFMSKIFGNKEVKVTMVFTADDLQSAKEYFKSFQEKDPNDKCSFVGEVTKFVSKQKSTLYSGLISDRY